MNKWQELRYFLMEKLNSTNATQIVEVLEKMRELDRGDRLNARERDYTSSFDGED